MYALTALTAPLRSGPRKRKRGSDSLSEGRQSQQGANPNRMSSTGPRKRSVRRSSSRRNGGESRHGRQLSEADGNSNIIPDSHSHNSHSLLEAESSSVAFKDGRERKQPRNDVADVHYDAQMSHINTYESRPSKRARKSGSNMFYRNTLDIGGSVSSGVASAAHERPKAVEYQPHFSIPDAIASTERGGSDSKKAPASVSSLTAWGAVHDWKWPTFNRNRIMLEGRNVSPSPAHGVANASELTQPDQTTSGNLNIFSPSGRHFRPGNEDEYWEEQSINMQRRREPHRYSRRLPRPRYRQQMQKRVFLNNQSALPESYMPVEGFGSPRAGPVGRGSGRGYEAEFHRTGGSLLDVVGSHQRGRRLNGNIDTGTSSELADYKELVNVAQRLDRENYMEKKKASVGQILNLRRKTIIYKEKHNLPISSPSRMPDSLLPRGKLDSQSSAKSQTKPNVSEDGTAKASDSVDLNLETVNESDIADYQNAIASNPDPFGLASTTKEISSAVLSALPNSSAAALKGGDAPLVPGSDPSQEEFNFDFSALPKDAPEDEVETIDLLTDSESEQDDEEESSEGADDSETEDGGGEPASDGGEESGEPVDSDGYFLSVEGETLVPPSDATFGTPFTQEEFNMVSEVMDKADPSNDVQISTPPKFKIPISYKDFYTLTSGQWLNDEVVNYYNSLLMLENRKAVQDAKAAGSTKFLPNCYWMKSDFYAFLNNPEHSGYDYQRIKGYLKKRNTKKFGMNDVWSEADMVIVPINIGRTHWAVGVVNVREERFEMYDSMYSGDDQHLRRLQRWTADEFNRVEKKDIKNPVDQWRFFMPGPSDVPQQRNGFDCGVFSTMFGEWVSKGRGLPMTFGQSNMPYLRHRMALSIWQNEISA